MIDPPARDSTRGLRERIAEAGARALAAGWLQPLATERTVITDQAAAFVVYVALSLASKASAAAGPGAAAGNPFLPYDPHLFVADLSATHVCLLNKYNVLAGHVLLVTREFVEQDTPFVHADFDAMLRLLDGIDGLAFYNSGPQAGASQRHRHMQFVPLRDIPLEPAIAGALRGGPRALPVRCALGGLDLPGGDNASTCLALCNRLLAEAGSVPPPGTSRLPPCNLLMTRRWMMIVPRAQECFGDISVNALGFAGTLFVRDRAQLSKLREAGPWAVLRGVALPAD